MPHDTPADKSSQVPRVSVAGPSLAPALLQRLKVGADSREALQKASGGVIERMGRRSLDNAFILNIDGQRFVYARVQGQGGQRADSYRTDGLRRALDPAGRFKGHDLDHVASARIEGARMGNRFALLAMVPAAVNRSHGATNEKGPAPTREFAKVAIAESGKGHASGWTREMVMKMSGLASQGPGRSVLRTAPSQEALVHAHRALLQSPEMQTRLARLAQQGRALDAKAAAPKAPARTASATPATPARAATPPPSAPPSVPPAAPPPAPKPPAPPAPPTPPTPPTPPMSRPGPGRSR
uniref:hypothetical protein n=1 Tax=unclassified Variovorax TaxID=663243 RepID=UPI000D4E1774